MDRAFLSYYEAELTQIRTMAEEFADMHPTVARNLSLDTVPCTDPYVERLLEGVAYLGARTRLKLDVETSRYVRNLTDALYPDLAGPAPAMSIVHLAPGGQVQNMLDGHRVKRGTRLVAGLKEGLSTRAVFTTVQDVVLWPVAVTKAEYLQDRGALKSAGIPDTLSGNAETGLRLEISRTSPGPLSDLSLDSLDLFLGAKSRGPALFDGIFGSGISLLCRPSGTDQAFAQGPLPAMIGVADSEGLLPRVRSSFEGYRLLREYFLFPERFHYARLGGLGPAVRQTEGDTIEVMILLSRPQPDLQDVSKDDFQLHATPLVNLFERECNLVELDPRRHAHVVHVDRTRPRDFEIYRLLRVEDAAREGPEAQLFHLYSVEPSGVNLVYTTERRARRPGEDERRRGQMRTSYAGDDFYISVARPLAAREAERVTKLDIRALCTNRDLPILDDTPTLTLESGDPVGSVKLLQAFRRPRASLMSALNEPSGGEMGVDDLTWRWISQLSLNHLSLVDEGEHGDALRATLELYADRGDPTYARHTRSIARVSSAAVIERLKIPGPTCFGHGTEITLDVDDNVLSGSSRLLLSALLAQLFSRHAAINSFVRTRTRLTQQQEETVWPMTTGTRPLI